MLRLILPDSAYLTSYVAALREGYYLGVRKTPDENEIKKIEDDPYDHLEMLNHQGGYYTFEDGIERKRVPFNYYWLVDEDDFIGAIDIRYELNDFLAQHAGHIGYGVRPSKKRQGHAKRMLAMALEKLKAKRVTRVMVTADDTNIGSWRTIEANGGVLQDKVPSPFHSGGIERRYWIELI